MKKFVVAALLATRGIKVLYPWLSVNASTPTSVNPTVSLPLQEDQGE